MIKQIVKKIVIFGLVAFNSACSHWLIEEPVGVLADPCDQIVTAPVPANVDGLDGSTLRFMSWNVQKGQQSNWQQDLVLYGQDKDLILFQEAGESMVAMEAVQQHHWFFAPGYQAGKEVTGVATLSKVKPIGHCALTAYEPWLGTPKATNITRYALLGSDQSLLVVNMHMVNFVWSNKAFEQQLHSVVRLLHRHHGPVIVSGDFNTWRGSRTEILQNTMAQSGLVPVLFAVDHRSRFFGYPVDHIYVTGFKAESAKAFEVHTSDHNPLVVDLTKL